MTRRWSEIDSRYLSTDPHFPFIVSINLWSDGGSHPFHDDDLSCWLLDYIGENHKDWEWWWNGGTWLFEFKREEDKVRFILRWV